MLIPIVNEEDEVIGSKERGKLDSGDIYRVAALWITNAKGDMLLAQNAATKMKYPGKWAAAVAGTVEGDEDYDTNIVKEAKEEIGLVVSIDKLERGPKFRFKNERSNHFAQNFFYVFEGSVDDLKTDPVEVAQLKWFARDELKRMLVDSPDSFSPSALRGLGQILE